MQRMLKICEVYADQQNLQFSTNPVPAQSKSKCIFMCGYMDPVYPLPLQLCGQTLPWVQHGTHLGHELHQMCNMDMEVYGGHCYGSMLWDLFGDKVGQLCRSWSTCVKLAWDLPRSTHTYLVEDVLAKDYLTVKQQLVGRFTNFFRSLLKSKSIEICVVANMVGRCAQSTTGGNLIRIHRETGQDPWKEPAWKVRDGITRAEVPQQEGRSAVLEKAHCSQE
jgi:hypothetical protein